MSVWKIQYILYRYLYTTSFPIVASMWPIISAFPSTTNNDNKSQICGMLMINIKDLLSSFSTLFRFHDKWSWPRKCAKIDVILWRPIQWMDEWNGSLVSIMKAAWFLSINLTFLLWAEKKRKSKTISKKGHRKKTKYLLHCTIILLGGGNPFDMRLPWLVG